MGVDYETRKRLAHQRLRRLMPPGIAAEERTLEWLLDWPPDTVERIAEMIERARGHASS